MSDPSEQTFTKRSRLNAPAGEVFAWHTRPGALERLLTPWQPVRILRRTGGIQDGAQVTIRMRAFGMPVTWTVEHRDYIEGQQFRDVQISGPFAHWTHTHRVEPIDEHTCELIDHIDYRLPAGALGRKLGAARVKRDLQTTFDYRHALLAQDLAQHREIAQGQKLTVAISGARGFVGRALVPLLSTGGHTVRRIVRGGATHDRGIGWSAATGEVELSKLDGVDAVVHLAGEPIMGRWTAAKKQRIRDSRVKGTRQIAEALAAAPRHLDNPPRVLINASAVGYYGDRGDELLDESSEPGTGFLAETCAAWEYSTEAARQAGLRVAMMRIGLVLHPSGGALASMLPLFGKGLGGRLGNGAAWWPWITRDDLAGAIYHALCNESVSGPVNAVGPAPVTNKTFTKVLGRVLHRPTVLPVPKFAARLAMGEVADAALFASARVLPGRLQETGYRFRDPELEPALQRMLGAGESE